MSYSDYLENFLLNALVGGCSAKTLYVGYGTADASEDGSTIAEPTGGAYARVAYGAYTVTTVGSGDDQHISNNAAITFPTASAAQGTISHVYFFDASSGGNFLGQVSFSELGLLDIAVIIGTTIIFAIGDCKVKLD